MIVHIKPIKEIDSGNPLTFTSTEKDVIEICNMGSALGIFITLGDDIGNQNSRVMSIQKDLYDSEIKINFSFRFHFIPVSCKEFLLTIINSLIPDMMLMFGIEWDEAVAVYERIKYNLYPL